MPRRTNCSNSRRHEGRGDESRGGQRRRRAVSTHGPRRRGRHGAPHAAIRLDPCRRGAARRVITPLGEPLDGKGPIEWRDGRDAARTQGAGRDFPPACERAVADGIEGRGRHDPIGRGRERIIGDRQTEQPSPWMRFSSGAISRPAIRSVLHVAVGQKASTVAALVETQRQHRAMEYTIVVAATAADPAACSISHPRGSRHRRVFPRHGRHALVVYDDLSKQAVAYREVSLILPPVGPRGSSGRYFLPPFACWSGRRRSSRRKRWPGR